MACIRGLSIRILACRARNMSRRPSRAFIWPTFSKVRESLWNEETAAHIFEQELYFCSCWLDWSKMREWDVLITAVKTCEFVPLMKEYSNKILMIWKFFVLIRPLFHNLISRYELMRACWSANSTDRPTFTELRKHLGELLEDVRSIGNYIYQLFLFPDHWRWLLLETQCKCKLLRFRE